VLNLISPPALSLVLRVNKIIVGGVRLNRLFGVIENSETTRDRKEPLARFSPPEDLGILGFLKITWWRGAFNVEPPGGFRGATNHEPDYLTPPLIGGLV
jgi:hypothetical protein